MSQNKSRTYRTILSHRAPPLRTSGTTPELLGESGFNLRLAHISMRRRTSHQNHQFCWG